MQREQKYQKLPF